MSDAVSFTRFPVPNAERSERWVRVRFGGLTVADSKHPVLLLQYGPGALPTYFFARGDVRTDLLSDPQERDGRRFFTVRAGDRVAPQAAWVYVSPPPGLELLDGHITFDWEAADAWLEEDEQVFTHARDPHKRVDVMESSRRVEVSVAGEVIADTRRPRLLFETHLPTRYYLPREDVRLDLLLPSPSITRCPYKGIATYWSVRAGGDIHEDLAWTYEDPIPENPKIRELIAFFNERVDLRVDGEPLTRPSTPWSR